MSDMITLGGDPTRIRALADAWAPLLRAAGVKNADGTAHHLTLSGNPLPRLVTDAEEGEELDKGVYSRGRRHDIADDVEWTADLVQQFNAMKRGEIKQSKAALKVAADEKIDIRKFAALDDLRDAIRGEQGKAVVLSLTPARRDEAPALFTTTELILGMPEIVRLERVMPYARQIFPMRFLNAPGANGYRIDVLDEYGDAQMTSNFDGTPPLVGQNRTTIFRPLEFMWMGAQWGLRELDQWQQARANGLNLPGFAQERPRIAREALLRQENMWLWFGGPKGSQILGFLGPLASPNKTAQGVDIVDSPNWVTLTPAAVVKLITDQITAISLDGIELADTVLMPVGMYNWLGTTQWPNTEKMILGVLMDNLRPLGIKEIVAVPELTYRLEVENKLKAKQYHADDARRYAGGIDGKDVMVVLSRRQDKVAGIVSQDVKSLAPEVRPATTSVTLILGSGGVEVRYPKAHRIVRFDAPPP